MNITFLAQGAQQVSGVFFIVKLLLCFGVVYIQYASTARKRDLLLELGAAETCETAADRCTVSFPGSV